MTRLVPSRTIEWIVVNKQVLDIDKRHTIEFITKREENSLPSGYYAVSGGKFLPTSGASLIVPIFKRQGFLTAEDEIEEITHN
jgi:hypothetical protein